MEQINNLQVVPCTDSNYLKPFRVHYSQRDICKLSFVLSWQPPVFPCTQNGTKKYWDFMRTHDSVSVLIFNTTSHCFVLVKQFRPAVYMCEWERSKPKPPEPAEGAEGAEGAEAGAAAQPEASEAGEGGSDGGEKAGEDAAGDAATTAAPGQPPASAGVTYELCAGLVDKPNLTLEEIARQEVLEECGYDVPVTKLRRITSYRSGVGVTGAKQTMFYAEVSEENRVGEGGGQPQEGELIEVVKVPLHEAMSFAYDERIPKTMGVIFSFIWFQSNMSPKYKISTNV
ncbi:uridine diphosphate glucose pyrophosphatase NUDT14 isoform X1 [Sardina pilchardus]|uniref:uridine diphosphate glucose pyrophosphatase NUDT14 isoform X1 n=1 Tax=Sardina pilchardus TaxID=27697 RepID=UPI002E13DBFA